MWRQAWIPGCAAPPDSAILILGLKGALHLVNEDEEFEKRAPSAFELARRLHGAAAPLSIGSSREAGSIGHHTHFVERIGHGGPRTGGVQNARVHQLCDPRYLALSGPSAPAAPSTCSTTS